MTATFKLTERGGAYANEFGYYRVDDASGRIGNQRPGDAGYAQVALISPMRLEPHSSLPLPPVLFGAHAGARKNSTGLDLTVPTMREPLMAALASTTVPVVPEFSTVNTASAFAAAHASYRQWSKTPVSERATILRRAADTMLEQTPAFCALLVKEAHKTWGDAVSEVREAVDFLRSYTDEAGNSVLAKPAEQTPGVAQVAVQLMHAAGVPAEAPANVAPHCACCACTQPLPTESSPCSRARPANWWWVTRPTWPPMWVPSSIQKRMTTSKSTSSAWHVSQKCF